MNVTSFDFETFFTNEAKNPFTYNINLSKVTEQDSNIEFIFNKIKEIFTIGLLYKTDNKFIESNQGKIIQLEKINKDEILKVREYMLSIGIETIYKTYNLDDIDYHIRKVIYSIENIEGIKINTITDWKTQNINNIQIFIKTEQGDELKKILKKYPISNYFLNLYKPENIQDFKIQFKKEEDPDTIHIITFKEANITDYHYNHQFMDNFDKHVR